MINFSFTKHQWSGLLKLSLISAILTTACDLNHIYTETLSYTSPLILGQAWFVFPGFTLTFIVMGMAFHGISLLGNGQLDSQQSRSAGTFPGFFNEMLIFVLAYILSGFANEHASLLTLLLYGLFLIRWIFSYEKGLLLIIAILLGIGGMIGEGLSNVFDLNAYRAPEIFYVPWWLGGLYMNGAFALREGMRYFVYSKQK